MALLNQPPKATQSKESAPEVLSYRQRLYDRETLMLPNEPWNPAARLAQVRSRCDVWMWRARACGRARSVTRMSRRLAPPAPSADARQLRSPRHGVGSQPERSRSARRSPSARWSSQHGACAAAARAAEPALGAGERWGRAQVVHLHRSPHCPRAPSRLRSESQGHGTRRRLGCSGSGDREARLASGRDVGGGDAERDASEAAAPPLDAAGAGRKRCHAR